MEHEISEQMLRDFREQLNGDAAATVARYAASKTGLLAVCYNSTEARKMNHMFSLEIPTMPACDQEHSGRCWIFAGVNLLREKIGKALDLEEFQLSQNYIAFYDHLEKADAFYAHIIETAARPLDDRELINLLKLPVGDGGWWEFFVGISKKYGVCPRDSMPETDQSGDSEDMNMLLNMQLRSDAAVLRERIAAGISKEELSELRTGMLSRVYRFLTICLGMPPETFDFEYVDREKNYHADRNLTPKAFYAKYFEKDLEQTVSILHAPVEGIPFYKTYVTPMEESIRGKHRAKRLNLPLDEFKAAVIRQLQAGEPVWFVCDCDYYLVDDDGIWDTGSFDFETGLGLELSLDKGRLLQYRQTSLNHAMLLTGVNLVDGRPDKWKVQNSWGTKKGKDGYYVMSDPWFDRYVFTASIDWENLTERQQELFRQEPVECPLWSVLA